LQLVPRQPEQCNISGGQEGQGSIPEKSHRMRIVVLPGNLEVEDQLDELVTASLSRRIEIPPEHFGRRAEEPFEGDINVYLKECKTSPCPVLQEAVGGLHPGLLERRSPWMLE
jgi:hypothetical protein